jgi:glutamate-1-semialdehyde 2,1-aminomutase
MTHDRYGASRAQHVRARERLAGGVATAFRSGQQPVPITFVEAKGSHLTDLDGNEYVDYSLAFGPMLLGHSPDEVIRAVTAQLGREIGVGASNVLEAELAEAIGRTVPSAELCVFSNSGSEAVQVALRIARAATGRRRVVKFSGHYHGWLDSVHVAVPGHLSGPGTGGQDPMAAEALTICDWDDVEALDAALDGEPVAAIIMEPVAVNGGCLLPGDGYLEAVRDLASRSGAVLIFDEVITGFRVALGGAQARLGVIPDLTVLGKALGSGFPISAVCGREDVMDVVTGGGSVAHVGTFNANPICASAALAAVAHLERSQAEIYPQLEAMCSDVVAALEEATSEQGLALTVNRCGAAAYGFASPTPVSGFQEAASSDVELYRSFVREMLDEGVHMISRGLMYVSTVHTTDDVERTRAAASNAAKRVASMHASVQG